jgi:hypothetical protein
VGHGAGNERRPDDVEEELELGGGGGGPVGGGAVEGLELEPGAHVGAAGAAALVGAGGVDEHLIGDGHLQHGVQGVVAVQVRAQLPHLHGDEPAAHQQQSRAIVPAGDRGERNERGEGREGKGRPGTRTCREGGGMREEYVDRANNGGRVEEPRAQASLDPRVARELEVSAWLLPYC